MRKGEVGGVKTHLKMEQKREGARRALRERPRQGNSVAKRTEQQRPMRD